MTKQLQRQKVKAFFCFEGDASERALFSIAFMMCDGMGSSVQE
jgi:hypothetical protein